MALRRLRIVSPETGRTSRQQRFVLIRIAKQTFRGRSRRTCFLTGIQQGQGAQSERRGVVGKQVQGSVEGGVSARVVLAHQGDTRVQDVQRRRHFVATQGGVKRRLCRCKIALAELCEGDVMRDGGTVVATLGESP